VRFEHNGQHYQITFHRGERRGASPPNTTVYLNRVVERDGKWEVVEQVRTATVGLWHREKSFSPNKGRIHALRALLPTLEKDMWKPLWAAYNGRFTARNN
jgi:hypothetical protein